MKALRSTLLVNAAAAAISSHLLLGGCSGQSLVSDKGLDRRKNPPAEINANASDNGAGSAATVPQENQNEFQGVIEPELIAAAYLVCFKVDSQGNQIACNLYDTKTDKRIPVETVPGGSWQASAKYCLDDRPCQEVPIPAINSSSLGSQFKLAFAAGPVPVATYMGKSPRILVSFTLPGTSSPTNFSGGLGSMPMLKDMGAFGVAKDLKVNSILATLSSFLNYWNTFETSTGQITCSRLQAEDCTISGKFEFISQKFVLYLVSMDTGKEQCNSVKNLALAILCRN